jgi:hypothetical protein
MKQQEIDTIAEKILALNDNPEKLYEFVCACKNVSSLIENKIEIEYGKKTREIAMKSFLSQLGGNG